MKEVFHSLFPRIQPYLQIGFLPTSYVDPSRWLLPESIYGTAFNNSKHVNTSGANSMTYFIYSVTLLHLLVFVQKTNFSSLKTCFLLLLKRYAHGHLIKMIQ